MVVPWFVILYLSQCLPATTSMELLIDCPDRLVPAARNFTGRRWACAVLRMAFPNLRALNAVTGVSKNSQTFG